MDIAQWIDDLARRLELGADLVNDLANGAWVPTEADRGRLFRVEVRLWCVSRQARRGAALGARLLPLLGEGLSRCRALVLDAVAVRACEEEDGLAGLQALADDLGDALSEIPILPRVFEPLRMAAGGWA
jgi:hypothetical protein